MRVLQIIDTLQPGGAERMAVSYAELLHKNGHVSFFCCTRNEGILRENLSPEIGYLFLNKNSALDLSALLKLRKFVIENRIGIVHAHSTSYFFASLLKLSGLTFKLVWHDHYGESELLHKRKFRVLKRFARTFDGIISVNRKLKNWAVENLKTGNVRMINNFVLNTENKTIAKKLEGPERTFKIICLANLRPQKDHLNLLGSFEILSEKISTTLHLIGNNPETVYSKEVLDKISNSKFKDRIFYYGTQMEVLGYLKQADLGVLASRSEGLPVALLEYGLAGLPVVVTNVGECNEVVNGYAEVVVPENIGLLANTIFQYYENENKRLDDAIKFQNHVVSQYGEDSVYNQIINFYSNL